MQGNVDTIIHYTDEFGHQHWMLNGVLHRKDGPAYISNTGAQQWSFYGITHREDGPAVTWSDGEHGWWINGYRLSFDDYCKQLNLTPEHIHELKLKYG